MRKSRFIEGQTACHLRCLRQSDLMEADGTTKRQNINC